MEGEFAVDFSGLGGGEAEESPRPVPQRIQYRQRQFSREKLRRITTVIENAIKCDKTCAF
jgi:hypothetical protein